MNRSEYISDVKAYIDDLETEFSGLQALVWKGLLEFHDICVKHDIPYQLAYGSLLGVIRDGGQVPWDYDIDTFVKYKDRDRLVEALKSDLSDEFFLDCYELDPSCESYKLRVTPRGMDPMLVHVDIFLLIPAPVEKAKRIKIGKKLVLLSKMRKYKTNSFLECNIPNLKMFRLKSILLRLLYSPLSLNKVDSMYEKTVRSLMNQETGLYMRSDRRALAYNEYPAELIDNVIAYNSENGKFLVPKDYKRMLEQEFGDYTKYPTIKSRFEEWYNSCRMHGIIAKVNR